MKAWRAYLSLVERVGGALGSGVLRNIEDERDMQEDRVKRAQGLLEAKDVEMSLEREQLAGVKGALDSEIDHLGRQNDLLLA